MKQRLIGFLLALLMAACPVLTASATEIGDTENPSNTEVSTPATTKVDAYDVYRALNADKPVAKDTISVSIGEGVPADSMLVSLEEAWNGKDQVLVCKENAGAITWPVSVEKTGWYCIALTYHTVQGEGKTIPFSLMINGKTPFSGCELFELFRFWRDILVDDEMPRDANDNEIQPSQEEVYGWETVRLSARDGLYDEPFLFFFEAGEHQITLNFTDEPVAIGAMELCPPEAVENYEKPTVSNSDTGALVEVIQGEKPSRKTDEVLHPVYDRTDAANQPTDPFRIRLNTIGGESWKVNGQWIEWEFEVSESGYYQIGSRFRQKISQGSSSSRLLRIDDEIPFEECKRLSFAYDLDWKTEWFGDEEPYLFWLEAGPHTLRLQVTAGDMNEMIRSLSNALDVLNDLYRKIVMITSVQPDPSRDYDVDQQIPGLLESFDNQAATLRKAAKTLRENASGGSQAASLDRIAERLETFSKKPFTITERLSGFRDDLSSLGALLLDLRSQPLEIDYLFIAQPGAELPAAKAGFFKQLWNQLLGFFASFVMDYDQIGAADSDRCIDVWMTVGREQANQLRRQIDSDFVEQTGISVKLRLVTVGLVQAVMAGEEPDVSLNADRTAPLNLWLRGALTELQDMEGLDEVKKEFSDTAFDPYMTGDALYALPETQTFNMMFYRKDIFEELGITPPETWEDLYRISQIIQRANLEVGLPSTYTLFASLLLQNGGSFFAENNLTMTTDSPIGHEKFKEWVDFYLEYSFPLNKNEYNRFRTGEMPLVITPYAFYNQLSATAPDIQGLWEMLPVPGVRGEDGQIKRQEITGGTACVMLATTENKEDSWTFMKWWVSADTQAKYGRGIEMALGEAARYTPANREALNKLGWTKREREKLQDQWNHVVDLPEVPGGYYISRNLDNAFRACVYKFSDPREMLNYWTYETNKEIARKCREFGLNL